MAGAKKSPLNIPVRELRGVGPKLDAALKAKGISTVEDLLFFFPRDYEDRRKITKVKQLVPGQTAVVFGTITATTGNVGSARFVRGKRFRAGGSGRFEASLHDDTGVLQLVWFRSFSSLERDFPVGMRVLAVGEVSLFGRGFQMAHPDYEIVSAAGEDVRPPKSLNFGRVVPVYPALGNLSQKVVRKVQGEAIKALLLDKLEDPLDEGIRNRLGLPSLSDSFREAHFPEEIPEGGRPRGLDRLAFEEFFTLQIGLGLRRQKARSENAPSLIDVKNLLPKYFETLPFAFTPDQKSAFDEVKADLARPFAMTRLVQGDVGSGKTVVALAAAVLAASSGYQTAILAPTEILAQQHFRNAVQYLDRIGIPSCLLAQGVQTAKEKRDLLEVLEKGYKTVVIGTHALFQSGVQFKNLGLVIVDEQHRFGVEQRADLVRKGKGCIPHLLLMTATPIPRTLGLTLYGDLDITWIRNKPAQRGKIETRFIPDRERFRVFERIRQTIAKGEQAYVIYPLVEASEKIDLQSAVESFHKLSREVFPGVPMALLHGKMPSDEKERTLREFRDGKYKILVATTVVEVGIDVPNATLMVIEHAERLGLSQLHQLRGRIGRGKGDSECLLVSDVGCTRRLQVMQRTDDGFVIAEEDLKIRGPGEFLGTRQSGLPGFRAGHLVHDAELLVAARNTATDILNRDPFLEHQSHLPIRQAVEHRWKEKLERLRGV